MEVIISIGEGQCSNTPASSKLGSKLCPSEWEADTLSRPINVTSLGILISIADNCVKNSFVQICSFALFSTKH